jgi:hypothetical protein
MINDALLIQDRIRSLDLQLELNRLHVPRGLKAHIRFNEKNIKVASREGSEETRPDQILQCPVCLARPELLPAAKDFQYSRKDALQTYFRAHKLPMFFDNPGRQCDIPGCVHVYPSLNGYKLSARTIVYIFDACDLHGNSRPLTRLVLMLVNASPTLFRSSYHSSFSTKYRKDSRT